MRNEKEHGSSGGRQIVGQWSPLPWWTSSQRLWPVLLAVLLAAAQLPGAYAWDHAGAELIRSQTVDAAVTAALPGYTFTGVQAGGHSLWFYYKASGTPVDPLASLELQISFRDGLPVSPMVNCWKDPAIFGPTADFVGEEALAYDGSRSQPPTRGHWVRARAGGRSIFLRDGGAPFAQLTALARSLVAALPTLPLLASFEDEPDPPNRDYIELDRAMFVRVTPGLLADPPQIDVLTPRHSGFEDHDLGFGYRVEGRAAGGGYLSVYGTVLWQGSGLEALQVSTYYPRPLAPAGVYQAFFQPVFGDTNPETSPRIRRLWGYDRAAEPLPATLFHARLPDPPQMADHPDRATIAWLMTPFSGTSYGTRGGYAGSQLGNRRAWSQFTKLDASVCLYLLRSKNPATRLTAIETLRRNASSWGIDLSMLAADFETIYRSVPKVETMNGCIVSEQDAHKLVDRFTEMRDPAR